MVFKIVTQKSRNYLFVSSIALTFLVLALATPIVFNFEEFFSVGYYRTDEDYRIEYSDGYGEVNMDLQLELSRQYSYSFYISCYFSSSEDVEIVGMTHLNYTVSAGGSVVLFRVEDWDPPTEQFTRASRALLKHNEAIIWSGSAEVQFISNSSVQNETVNFNLRITIPLSYQDYSDLDLISYVISFSWFFAFLVVPLLLKFIIKPGHRLDPETEKKHKKYFDYFKKSQEEEEEEA